MTKLHKKPKSAEDTSAERKPHTHKWNDQDKCEICGASPIPGRAYNDMFRQGSRPIS
jgi:hypothetical protein